LPKIASIAKIAESENEGLQRMKCLDFLLCGSFLSLLKQISSPVCNDFLSVHFRRFWQFWHFWQFRLVISFSFLQQTALPAARR